MLQQPISKYLGKSRSVLLAGCGNGYDAFGAVPLLVELVLAGRHVHLASMSETYLAGLNGAGQVPAHPCLYKVGAAAAASSAYCPEAWLARWLEEQLGRRQPVWCFDRVGVKPLRAAFQYLVEQLSVDLVVLVDSGLDALMRGDEPTLDTPPEDFAAVSAVAGLEGVRKVLASIGMGTGAHEDLNNMDVLERIAELTREGAFLGTAALLGANTSGKVYQDAIQYAFDNQAHQKKSEVHALICRAVTGEFGAANEHAWLSPLVNMFWFFELGAVARTSVIPPCIEPTLTFGEISVSIDAMRRELGVNQA
jgi:hypothetical protein